MILDVSRALKSAGELFPFHVEEEIPAQEIYGEEITFTQIELTGRYSATEDDIAIFGTLTGKVHAICANCLKEAVISIDVPFSEIFIREGDAEDPDVFLYTGGAIDISRLAMTTAVLALPMRFLCGKDCRGVCPDCGGDLNLNQCLCHKQTGADNPFAALKQLLDQDEEV